MSAYTPNNWPLAVIDSARFYPSVITNIQMAVRIAEKSGMKPQRVLLGRVKWEQFEAEVEVHTSMIKALLGMAQPAIIHAQTVTTGHMVAGVRCEQGNLPGITVL